ncbi:MAG: phosphopantetheine-binding protein [Mollicutes bacterium PWAP]|nr:phosphopantetheine-binding protein [Mollicutes bacterium PWAP]
MGTKKLVFSLLKKMTKKDFNDNSLIEELDIDSLDLVEMITEVEEKFGFEVTDEQISKIKKVSDLIKNFDKLKSE